MFCFVFVILNCDLRFVVICICLIVRIFVGFVVCCLGCYVGLGMLLLYLFLLVVCDGWLVWLICLIALVVSVLFDFIVVVVFCLCLIWL